MRATSAWVTGEDVIRFGESFLACGNGVDADFEHSGEQKQVSCEVVESITLPCKVR